MSATRHTGGHLFVLPGDLLKLSCDAWAIPCDARFHVMSHWRQLPAIRRVAHGLPDGAAVPDDWGPEGARVARITDWDERLPGAWLVNSGSHGRPPEWYAEGVRQLLVAFHEASSGTDRSGRARPLLAMPLLGTGAGGAADRKSPVLRALIAELLDGCASTGVDVALVLKDKTAFTAALAVRDELSPGVSALPAVLDDAIDELAQRARAGELVVFLGAGVSAGAGLPLWRELLDDLATEAGFSTSELSRYSPLDQARLIQRRMGLDAAAFGQRVAARFERELHALSHGLLAALPVDHFVTTNYDRLFEAAADAVCSPVRVLPYDVGTSRRWLLKLHGSIERAADIVLTREDYMRYGDRRQALAGIVQALLVTHHMLFVGFSLDDENFHRIADEVRKVVREGDGEAQRPFGTALVAAEGHLGQLWEGDIICPPAGSKESAEEFRLLEIALDELLRRAMSGPGHLLDPDFRDILTDEDRRLADVMQRTLDVALSSRDTSPAARAVVEAFKRFGASSG